MRLTKVKSPSANEWGGGGDATLKEKASGRHVKKKTMDESGGRERQYYLRLANKEGVKEVKKRQ